MGIKRLYFLGKKKDWLEGKRNQVLDELAIGKRVTQVFAAGVRGEKVVEVSCSTALQRLEHDLSIIDPANYPAASVMPIKHARAKYIY